MIAATIAIAPFENLSGDPSQDYFARGFVEDVATELSRFGTLEVLHPRSVTAFLRARATDADSGPIADHMLRGSVRQAGEVVRVAVQLVEAANGRQVWADRYDATAKDLLAVQDEIAARIAGALAIRVDEARLDVARRTPLASLEVYDCWLRGLDCIHRGTIEADAEARRFFERAQEIDPAYGRSAGGQRRARAHARRACPAGNPGALGLHNRSRQLGSAAERARSAVTWRMRSAMKKIASAHPRLGRHLENTVRTGTFCTYTPETPTVWAL